MKKIAVFVFVFAGLLICASTTFAATLSVSSKTYGDTKIHVLASSGGLDAVVVERDGLVAFDAFGNREDDAAYGDFIDSLRKPLLRMFLSHPHDHHWQGVNSVFPNTELYSVEADAINKESGNQLNVRPLPATALVVDGVI